MDIQQILIESHGVPSPVGGNDWHGSPMHAADFFNAFRSNHFAMFSKEVNVRGGGTSVEFGYVKLHPDFWEDTLKAAALEQIAIPSIVVPDAPPAPYRIPRRLIFIYETDLLNTENPVELFFNAKHIIDKYRGAWNESYAPVWFLDEPSCLAAIYQARVELIYFYRIEKNKQRKSDICRVAALYLSGGYYFDVNLEMGSLYEPDDDVSVAVAREGDRFSNMFLASEQKGSVVKAALDNMVAFYKRNDTRPDVRLGSETLAEAIRELNATVKVDILPLKEIVKYPPTPWIVAEMPVHSFDNPVPLEMSGPPSPGHKIPRRLIFTYKSNLLETKDPPLFYENVQKTIKMYREAWGEPKAPVWFLNDMDCRSAIYAAKPNLLVYFDREVHGSWKADICRVAALYLTGGYYFDVDMEAVDPWIPDRNVTFATALQPDKTRYFQSFLASERRGGILEVALDEMLLFYETKMIRTGKLLGPDTLKIAFNSVAISERGSTMFLEEVQFPEDEAAGLRDNGVGCCCNFGVQDPATNTRKFFSRVVGGSSGCLDRDSPEGQAYLKLAEAAAVDATRDASGRRD
jgi:mannosyltransferase OCH1-like enzyme